MTNNQLFFGICGVFAAFFGLFAGFLKYYLDARLDPLRDQLKMLVDYMVLHSGKIERLEERTKKL